MILGSLVGDNIKPSVAMTSPSGTISGTVSVSATSADNYGVVGVQFKIDGTNFGAEDTVAPYTSSLDTHTLTNGSHTITATSRDAVGNTQVSSVIVTVSNVAPTGGTLDFAYYEIWVDDDGVYEADRWNVRTFANINAENWIWGGTGTRDGTLSLPSNSDPTHYQMRVRGAAANRHEAGTDGNITTLSMYVNGAQYDVRIQDADQGIVVNVSGGETIYYLRYGSIDVANGSITHAGATYDYAPIFAS